MEFQRKQQYMKVDEIKSLLGLPEFIGIEVRDFPSECNRNMSTTTDNSDFSHIPEEIRATRGNTYASSEISAWGDQLIGWREQLTQKTAELKWNKRLLMESQNSTNPVYRNIYPLPTDQPDKPQKTAEFKFIKTQPLIESKKSTYSQHRTSVQTPSNLYNKTEHFNPENLHVNLYNENMHNFGVFGKPKMQSGFFGTNPRGQLKITPQTTLSLSLSDCLQVDITIDGAIRIINPKAFIAMSMNGMGTHAAVMHPMGRVLQEATTANILAYDMNHGCHKFAKLWQRKATFTSTDMTFSYTMDQAGTRTTMTAFPNMPTNDITLPVFLATSQHGGLYKEEAAHIFKQATCGIDSEGATVWTINNILIKCNNGDLRVIGPHSVFLRTSVYTGQLGLSTETLHCTASTGEEPHFFVRFGASKMHYNGQDFKLRTLSQAAGFDANNRITLF